MGKNLEIADLLVIYGSMLTDKQKDAMELYYDEDLSLAEIAENMSISRQGVRDSIKRGEDTLLELEEKLGLMRKQKDFNLLISSVLAQAKTIRKDLNAVSYSRLVQQKADALIKNIEDNLNLMD